MEELQTDDRGYLVVPSEYAQAWNAYASDEDDADTADEQEDDE